MFSPDLSRDYDSFSRAESSFLHIEEHTQVQHKNLVLTKCMAVLYRFRSRRVASLFWKWKYTPKEEKEKEKSFQTNTLFPISSVKKRNEESSSDNDENIDVDDGLEEKTIENKKNFDVALNYAGPAGADKKGTNVFEMDNKEMTQAVKDSMHSNNEPRRQMFYDILNSKNKDFGQLLQTSESMASELDHNMLGGFQQTGTAKFPINHSLI